MLSLRYLLVLFILASCGFSPVYKTLDSSSVEDLAAIEIITPKTLIGQFFETKLSDLLNPTSITVPKKYRIATVISKNEVPLAIQKDRTITRYKIIANLKYSILNLDTNKIIDEGVIKREGGYDKVDSDYATYISEEDTSKRIIKELAEDAKIRIMSAVFKK